MKKVYKIILRLVLVVVVLTCVKVFWDVKINSFEVADRLVKNQHITAM